MNKREVSSSFLESGQEQGRGNTGNALAPLVTSQSFRPGLDTPLHTSFVPKPARLAELGQRRSRLSGRNAHCSAVKVIGMNFFGGETRSRLSAAPEIMRPLDIPNFTVCQHLSVGATTLRTVSN